MAFMLPSSLPVMRSLSPNTVCGHAEKINISKSKRIIEKLQTVINSDKPENTFPKKVCFIELYVISCMIIIVEFGPKLNSNRSVSTSVALRL